MPEQNQQDDAGHHACRCDHLGDPQACTRDDKAVRAQALDKEAAGAVPDDIQQEGLAVIAAEPAGEEVQKHKAQQTQQGFIQKAGVHIAIHYSGGIFAVHAPGQFRGGAEGLLVDKVAPAAHTLANEETQGSNIQNSGNLQLAELGHQAAEHHSADNAAVDGQASVVNLEDLQGVFPVFITGIEDHIKQPRENYPGDEANNNHIEQTVDINVHFLAAKAGIDQCQQEPCRNDDAIPIHMEAPDGKSHRVDVELQPQMGKRDIIGHSFMSSFGSFMVPAVKSQRARFALPGKSVGASPQHPLGEAGQGRRYR